MRSFGTPYPEPLQRNPLIFNVSAHFPIGARRAPQVRRTENTMSTIAHLEPIEIRVTSRRHTPKRVVIVHQIQVSGFSATGDAFAEHTRTINVSERGCCFELARCLVPGDTVSIKVRRSVRGPSSFRVVWTLRKTNHWIVGALIIEPTDVWHMIFPQRAP
jgi:hypothetical protein